MNVDRSVKNVSKEDKKEIRLKENEEKKEEVSKILSSLTKDLSAEGSDEDENIARVSIIGAGMKSESGVASKMFKTLGLNQINIGMISTSPIRISCVISKNDMQKAIEVLHDEFIIE